MKKINVEEYAKSESELLNLEFQLIEKIVKIRNERGLSQRELCKIIGMKQPYLVKIENKQISPSINTIIKILSALNLKIEIIED